MTNCEPATAGAVRAPGGVSSSPLLLAAVCTLLAGLGCGDRAGSTAPAWQVYSIEYGHSERYPRSALVRGAAKQERVPLAWCAWLIRPATPGGRQILVDTGFVEPPKRPPERLARVDALLGGLGLAPRAITDVVITHLHWDHAGNLAPFDAARVWLQRRAYDWAASRVNADKPRVGGLRFSDLQSVDAARQAGRLELVDGSKEIAPGVILHRGGGHVPGLQWVEVRTDGPAGTVVLASDTAYLYENLEQRVATGSTRTPADDLKLYDKMLGLVSRPGLVIPGHDPLVARRFETVAPNIVAIE